MYFDKVFQLPLTGWLQIVAQAGDALRDDIVDQLRGCELSISAHTLATNSEISGVEAYIRGHREHRFFPDRQSLIAEYRRVWSLTRYAIAEGAAAAARYGEKVLSDDTTDAAARLQHKPDFERIITLCGKPPQLHPKVAKLLDLYTQPVGKTLVACPQVATLNELAAHLTLSGVTPTILRRGATKRFEQFRQQDDGIGLTTVTSEAKLGLVVDTIVHYNLLTTDLSYMQGFTPPPRRQTILLAVEHQYDLGSKFRASFHPRLLPPPPRPRGKLRDDPRIGSLFEIETT